jgi:hypothetical protein
MYHTIQVTTLCLLLLGCGHGMDLFKSYGPEVTETRVCGEFTEISAGEKFDIELVCDTAKAGTFEITAGKNVISGYTGKVVNGELRLLNENKFNWVRKLKVRQRVVVYFKTLNRIQVKGSAKYSSRNIFANTSEFTINHDGLEDADLKINGDYIYANCNNTGGVHLSGKCFLLSATADDISYVNSLQLDAEKCYLSSFSLSDSYLRASKEMAIKLYGAGNVYYTDTPSVSFLVEVSGKGKVIKY